MAFFYHSGNLPGRLPGHRAETDSVFHNLDLPGGPRPFPSRWLAGGLAVALSFGAVSCAGDSVDSQAAGGLAGKEMGAGGSFGPGYPPGSAAWSVKARTAYRTAFVAGMQDQKEGFRYDDDRGALALDVDLRGYFRQGYRRGYYHEATLRRLRRGESGLGLGESGGSSAAPRVSTMRGQGGQSSAPDPGTRGDPAPTPTLERMDSVEAPPTPLR